MRTRDWIDCPLGPPSAWPQSLKSLVGMMLNSKFPMFLIWGERLTCLYNDGYIPLLGLRHPRAMGSPFATVWPEVWNDIHPLILRAFRGDATYFENLPLTVTSRGKPERIWVTFSYSPLRDEAGVVAGMFCAFNETTGMVLAERRQAFGLRMSDRLKSLRDAGEIIHAAAALLGERLDADRVSYSEVSANGRELAVIHSWSGGALAPLPPQVQPMEGLGAQIAVELQAGRSVVVNDVLVDPRTAPHAERYHGIGIRAMLAVPLIKDGRLVTVLGCARMRPHDWSGEDVTLAGDVAERTWDAVERARAEEALTRQAATERDRLRTLFAQAPSFMAALRGPDHVFELANSAYLNLVGRRDILGKPVRVALPEVQGQGFFEALDHVYQSGEVFHANEARVVLQSEAGATQERYLDFVYQPLFDGNGRVGGIFVDGYDVTARRQAGIALREADQRKDEFLAMLAHELRNPLAPIATAAELLRHASMSPERTRRTSDIIARQVTHMTSLLDDLLDVSRVTRGQISLCWNEVDLHAVLAGACEQTRSLIEARGHQLRIAAPPQPLLVRGDATRLVQIVANLLNNAAKYTPEGGEIALSVQVERGWFTLSIVDNGIGMAADLLPRVFDLFTQAERSPDRSQGGLGLGLALVKSLVELHGGRAVAHSDGVGRGSRFSITLPALDASLAAPGEAASPSSGTSEASGQALSVLVVDDNADAAQMLELLLESAGHRVAVEHGATSALRRAQRETPQVCLLDIGLPGMDGHELARRLRALPGMEDAMLIALTGYGQERDRDESRAAGFDHHFVKPVDSIALLRLLRGTRHPGHSTPEV
ncbi:response regulator [Noviherbaspirillum sp. DKR-6]|uniref:histidine kinase n=2 Tax=Noviherbaspirillum pedocola TaxID=2801341 RepID=A0A934W9L5_9BURK|nr:response regulator [Noviherbaspirillum pedocola]